MPLLYVHIPFCEHKCVYCDFYSTESFALYDSFLDALEKEITSRAEDLAIEQPFSTLFFGGGTPSLLSGDQMKRIMDVLRRTYPLADDAEITAECNPGTVSLEKLKAYREAGLNRLSFGVQSFHEDDLEFLSRIHNSDEARNGIRMARDAGFENINLDLMFSLPGQTPERWLYNLEQARVLGTTHLSCYSLTVEQGTPLAVMVNKGIVGMPPQESDAELFDLTMKTLGEWGFRQYEVSNYALPGYECRHNLGYWRLDDYLGFGPSAHGTWNNRRQWNVSSLSAYVAAMQQNGTAVAGGEDLTPDVRREEYLFLRLRSEGVDISAFNTQFSADFIQENRTELDSLVNRGLIELSDASLRLTQSGMQFADEICVRLS